MENKKDLICPLPWMQSFVNRKGDYRLCCTSEETDNQLFDENDFLITVESGHGLDRIMNAPLMKTVRKMMMEGEWPQWCRRCTLDEKRGGVSRRMIEMQYREPLRKFFMDNTLPDGTLKKFEILEADYRLGNMCNLQCRMCSPNSSLRCLEYWNDVSFPRNKISFLEEQRLKSIRWFDTEDFINDFKMKVSTLEVVHFAGGEPLISPRMLQILEMAISDGYSKKMTLSYNTNLASVPDKIWDLWKQFKKVKLLVSIDGIGKLNEYIRLGSDWDQLVRNLEKVETFCAEYPQTEVIFCTTVQACNVLEIDQFFPFLQKFKHFVGMPNFVNLYHPPYLSTRVLPKEIKEKAKERAMKMFAEAERVLPSHYDYLRQNILNICQYMEGDDESDFESFLEYNKRVDARFKLNTVDYLPFLAPYLNS